jgi:predicted protein tyrosine phosphatase
MAKRGKRGYLFITGDELPYPAVSRHQVAALFGEALDEDIPIEEVIAAASESYHCFFLIPDKHRRQRCEPRWRELMGERVICMDAADDTCAVAAALVALTEKALPDEAALAEVLGAQGMRSERVSAVIRAVRPYAALLGHGPLPHASSTQGTAQRWWRKLFG